MSGRIYGLGLRKALSQTINITSNTNMYAVPVSEDFSWDPDMEFVSAVGGQEYFAAGTRVLLPSGITMNYDATGAGGILNYSIGVNVNFGDIVIVTALDIIGAVVYSEDTGAADSNRSLFAFMQINPFTPNGNNFTIQEPAGGHWFHTLDNDLID